MYSIAVLLMMIGLSGAMVSWILGGEKKWVKVVLFTIVFIAGLVAYPGHRFRQDFSHRPTPKEVAASYQACMASRGVEFRVSHSKLSRWYIICQ